MAYCPKCTGEMTATETVCPHCGYDFPDPSVEPKGWDGFIYSPLADAALLVCSIAAALGAVGALVGSIVTLIRGDFLLALFVGPIVCLQQLGILIVFLRVQR